MLNKARLAHRALLTRCPVPEDALSGYSVCHNGQIVMFYKSTVLFETNKKRL